MVRANRAPPGHILADACGLGAGEPVATAVARYAVIGFGEAHERQ